MGLETDSPAGGYGAALQEQEWGKAAVQQPSADHDENEIHNPLTANGRSTPDSYHRWGTSQGLEGVVSMYRSLTEGDESRWEQLSTVVSPSAASAREANLEPVDGPHKRQSETAASSSVRRVSVPCGADAGERPGARDSTRLASHPQTAQATVHCPERGAQPRAPLQGATRPHSPHMSVQERADCSASALWPYSVLW